MGSPLLLPPIPFPLPTQAAEGRGVVSPTSAHLIFCPSFGSGNVLVTCPNMLATAISEQCLTHQNDAPFRAGGWKKNAVLGCSPFPSQGVSLAPRLDYMDRGVQAVSIRTTIPRRRMLAFWVGELSLLQSTGDRINDLFYLIS